jgi:hypothetical protein
MSVRDHKDGEPSKAYFADQIGLEDKLKKDLLEKLGIAGHPNADVLLDIVLRIGCPNGYQDVVDFAEELSDLLKD